MQRAASPKWVLDSLSRGALAPDRRLIVVASSPDSRLGRSRKPLGWLIAADHTVGA
jgi:hypothetical protein